MLVEQLWLTDFRCYEQAHIALPPGLTVILGENGEGKTTVLEAVSYLASLESFRGAPNEAMVREGADVATVRAHVEREGREVLLEAEIRVAGRGRMQVNRQPLRRRADLLGVLQVSVFSPEDLAIVKGGPAGRRRFLDDVLTGLNPMHDSVRVEVDRVLKQRNALLKQARGRLTREIATTLDVWDEKLAASGEALGKARVEVIELLRGPLGDAYDAVSGGSGEIGVAYLSTWAPGGLLRALVDNRQEDLRRGQSQVGPHRDDVVLTISGLPSRTHASQGEQRSLALALRLASHRVLTVAHGTAPVLLLDDIFSELDPGRAAALLDNLPHDQVLLTSAGPPPADATPSLVLRVQGGEMATVEAQM